MKTAKHIFMALGAVALLAGCSENDWNDKLDGFEPYEPGTTTSSIEYTLTDADYTKIATKKPYTTYADEHDQAAELKLVGSNASFASEDQALEYLPMFLRDSTNTFFAMANGSAVKLNYNVETAIPAVVKDITANTRVMTVSEDQYIQAWDSETDYINAFAPSTPAARALPAILRGQFPDAQAGDYVVVTYNEAAENPIFGTVGGGEEPTPSGWEPTAVLTDIAVGDNVTVRGYVTAIDARGFVLTDAAGSILCYQASGFNTDNVSIGDQIEVTADITSYGTAFQIAISDGSYTVGDNVAYTYPAPTEVSAADMDAAVARTDNALAQYVCFKGTAVVGNYINFTIDGAATAQGSGYQVPQFIKDLLVNGEEYYVYGYFVSVSSGRYYNVVITDAVSTSEAKAPRRAPVVEVSTKAVNAIYTFNGTAWSVPADVVVLQPADYTVMGQTYANLSGTTPNTLLPKYLANKYPYAAADDVVTVAYNYYDGSASAYRAAQYTFDGAQWTRNTGMITNQFVKTAGFWFYNPSVVITLPYARNTDPSYTYYMACVNWVFDHIGKEMGGSSLTDSPFIDYRGNAEFWSGASAYYGNVDVRAVTAKNNMPADYTGYEGLTDDEISDLIKSRFVHETLPGALAMLHPDAVPVAGMEVTYTINFTAYTGSAQEVTVVYEVTAPATFTYKSCTWYE